jgi:outer membrane protein OmpA-like peptidoglycan-associated protein
MKTRAGEARSGRALGWVLLIGVCGAASTSAAQVTPAASDRSVGIDRFALAADREGVLDVEWGWTPRAGSWNGNLWGIYANDPLVVRDIDSNQRLGSLVHHRLTGQVGFAYSLADRFQLAAALPVVLWQDGQQAIDGVSGLPTQSFGKVGVGNLRVTPKLGLFSSSNQSLAVALLVSFIVPAPQTNGYFGDSAFGLQPELAVSAVLAQVRIAVNGGYHWRAGSPSLLGIDLRDELVARAGVGYRFGSSANDRGGPFELDVTISGATPGKAFFNDTSQDALAMAGALQCDLPRTITLFAGGGFGLLPAYGVPDFQLLAGLRFGNGAVPPPVVPVPTLDPDPDGDGIRGDADRCPTEAEDKDGFEDSDGCPDPDNDHDGVTDTDDACPGEGGPVANKGCPDKDGDNDGVADRLDRCPIEAEDKDGFEDNDGCPDPDNDHDGVADAGDACPNETGAADNKGCPDRDRDGDGIVDRRDNCPDEPGTAENSGCKAKQLAHITDAGIEIADAVYFAVDRDIIEKKSFVLLENVARIIRNHPEAGSIRVEGHTDSRGDDQHNQALSEHRAQAVVDFLVQKGVPRERLVARGYGETQPLGDDHTAAGRAQNRRVVFARDRSAAAPPQ